MSESDGTVTIEELIEQTGVTEEQLDSRCKIEHFEQISSNVGSYLAFANRMGLSEGFKSTLIANNLLPDHGQKAEEVFKQWRKNNGKRATYREFITICIKLKQGDLAETMCKLCAGIEFKEKPPTELSGASPPASQPPKMQQTRATTAQLSQECSDEALLQLSKEIDYDSFKVILGLSDAEIKAIDRTPATFNNIPGRCYDALKKWKSKNIFTSTATYSRLVELATEIEDGYAFSSIHKACIKYTSS